MTTPDRLSSVDAFERARQHDSKARELRARAASMNASADLHERWATRWRDWADDEYGDVPYPGRAAA